MRSAISFISLISIVLFPVYEAAAQTYVVPDSTPFHIRRAVESSARNDADKERDSGRQPAEILTLAGLQDCRKVTTSLSCPHSGSITATY